MFLDCGKMALVWAIFDDAIKLAHVYILSAEQMTHAQFSCLVCGVLAPVQLLPNPSGCS